MREKRKSYFRVNVKNKAPRDTKNENLPLKSGIIIGQALLIAIDIQILLLKFSLISVYLKLCIFIKHILYTTGGIVYIFQII
jgi:hypothetical protein